MELKHFLKAATPAEREQLARVCHDSVGYLYQLAGGHRFASPLLATHIEEASGTLAARSDGRLGTIPRASLVRYPEIFQGLDGLEGVTDRFRRSRCIRYRPGRNPPPVNEGMSKEARHDRHHHIDQGRGGQDHPDRQPRWHPR